MPVGEMFFWENVLLRTACRGKVRSGKFPFGELLFGELSAGEMYVREMSSGNCPSGKYPSGIFPSGKRPDNSYKKALRCNQCNLVKITLCLVKAMGPKPITT